MQKTGKIAGLIASTAFAATSFGAKATDLPPPSTHQVKTCLTQLVKERAPSSAHTETTSDRFFDERKGIVENTITVNAISPEGKTLKTATYSDLHGLELKTQTAEGAEKAVNEFDACVRATPRAVPRHPKKTL